MSTPAKLTLPAPAFTGDKLGADVRIDRPLRVGLGAVTLPGGAPLPASATVGAVLQRTGAAGEAAWNPETRTWVPVPGDEALGTALPLQPLQPAADAAQPWTLTLPPQDAAEARGGAQLDVADGDAGPRYLARVLVTATDGARAWRGLSPPSAPLSLVRLVPLAPAAPQLAFTAAGAFAALEKEVRIGLASLPPLPGGALSPDEVLVLGAFVYRQADGLWWNEQAQQWQPAPPDAEALAAHQPLALQPQPGATPPWQGVLAAAGQTDQGGAPRFLPVEEGGGAYQVRLFLRARRAGEVFLGLSPASAALRFTRTVGKERFKLEFDTGSPQACTVVTLRLADAAQVPAAFLRLRAGPRDAELAACDASGAVRAHIRLTADGDIELSPAPGRRLIVNADVEAEHIRYRPSGGGAKKDLP